MTTAAYSWTPSAPAARRDRRKLDAKTVAAIRVLLPDQDAESRTVLDELRRNAQVCHPEVFHWYFRFRNEQKSESKYAREMKTLPLLISESRRRAARAQGKLGLPIDTDPLGPGVADTLRRGAVYARPLAGEDVLLQPLSEWTPEMTGRITEALTLIRAVWPQVCDEMPVVVQKLIIYRGHAVIGFTDFRYHGSIFFKHEWLMKRPHLEEIAEDLIHEAAHVRLNSIMATTPLFRNDDREIYPSPLRRDLRSMYGVFHQMFVLRRVVEWYRRLKRRSMLQHPENLADNYEGFMQAYNVVKRHAELTPAGRTMLREMQPPPSPIRRLV